MAHSELDLDAVALFCLSILILNSDHPRPLRWMIGIGVTVPSFLRVALSLATLVVH